MAFNFNSMVRGCVVLLAASLAACGPVGPKDTEGASSSSGATSDVMTTGTPTSTGPTTGATIMKCADAKTEAECAAATEMHPNPGFDVRCRWGAVRVASFPEEEEMCTLEVVGGVCVLADSNEGGLGCWGFFREGEGGAVELLSLDCGSPVSDEWQSCFEVPPDSPAFASCGCINPDA